MRVTRDTRNGRDAAPPAFAAVTSLGWHIFPPVSRFRQILQDLIAPHQKPAHVTVKKHSVNNATKNPERRLELKAINHEGAWFPRDELVIVFHGLERTCYHDVLKTIGTLESCNAHGQLLLEAEVP
jgi:hypothetical protein